MRPDRGVVDGSRSSRSDLDVWAERVGGRGEGREVDVDEEVASRNSGGGVWTLAICNTDLKGQGPRKGRTPLLYEAQPGLDSVLRRNRLTFGVAWIEVINLAYYQSAPMPSTSWTRQSRATCKACTSILEGTRI